MFRLQIWAKLEIFSNSNRTVRCKVISIYYVMKPNFFCLILNKSNLNGFRSLIWSFINDLSNNMSNYGSYLSYLEVIFMA